MMQVRCQRCGWSFTLGRDTIALAVVEAEHQHDTHYLFTCPKCRHGVKVQVKQLRQRLPPGYQLPDLPERHAPISVKKDEEPEPVAPTPVAAKVAPPPKAAADASAKAQPKSSVEKSSKPAAKSKSAAKTASKTKTATKTKAVTKKTTKKTSAKKK